MFSLERKAKEQEREAKLGERELGELRSSNQYLLERLEQVVMVAIHCCLGTLLNILKPLTVRRAAQDK